MGKNAKVYHIAVNRDEMDPHDLWVRLSMDLELVRIGERDAKSRDCRLFDDPLYPALVRYVMANPPKVKA